MGPEGTGEAYQSPTVHLASHSPPGQLFGKTLAFQCQLKVGVTLDLLLNLRLAYGAVLGGSHTENEIKGIVQPRCRVRSASLTPVLPLTDCRNFPGLSFLICKVVIT